jgi:hypothetical protein
VRLARGRAFARCCDGHVTPAMADPTLP